MARIPDLDASRTISGQTQQFDVRPDIQARNTQGSQAKFGALSSIFDEAGEFYGKKYQESLRAEANMMAVKESADAQRYSMRLLEEAKKKPNDEEALVMYQRGMQQYTDERLKQYKDPMQQAEMYGAFNRISMSGEHQMFNYGQERRKQRGVVAMQEGLRSLDDAILNAQSPKEAQALYSQADRIVDTAASSGYVMPEMADRLKQQFRQDSSAARVTSLINSGQLVQATAELSMSEKNFDAGQVLKFKEDIVRQGRELEGIAAARSAQSSKAALSELKTVTATGESFDPNQYLSRMNEMDRLDAIGFMAKANKDLSQIQLQTNDFRSQLYSGGAVISGVKEKRVADSVYIQDIENNNYNSDGEKQAARLNFIRSTNYVPTPVAEQIEGAFTAQAFTSSGKPQIEPERKAATAAVVEQIRIASPTAYATLDAKSRAQAKQITDYMELGIPPAQAVMKVEEAAKYADDNKDFVAEVRKEANYSISTNRLADRAFDTAFSMQPDFMSDNVAASASKQYKDSYLAARSSGADEDSAQETAIAAVKAKYGVTEITGGRKIGYLPPEKMYNNLRSDPGENAAALKADFNAFVKKHSVGDKAKYSVVADAQSEYEFNVGKELPSYQVMVMKEDDDGRTTVQILDKRWKPIAWQKN